MAGPRVSMVHNTNLDSYAMRDGDWVLINTKSGTSRPAPAIWNEKHKQPADDKQPVELYNLKEDIHQRHNLAAKHPDRVQALLKKLRDQEHSAPRLESTHGRWDFMRVSPGGAGRIEAWQIPVHV